jgi:hypothetical protein
VFFDALFNALFNAFLARLFSRTLLTEQTMTLETRTQANPQSLARGFSLSDPLMQARR